MRYLNMIFGTIAAAAVVSACADRMESNDGVSTSDNPNLVNMTFGAVTDNPAVDAAETSAKTTYLGREVFWETDDKITVISVAEGVATPSDFTATQLSADMKTAKFEGVAVANSSCYYAVYPHDNLNALNVETGELTINLPSQQIGVPSSFSSGSNIAVAYSPADAEPVDESYILGFKNVPALLAFRFETDEDAERTKSVTFKIKKSATEYFGIAGTASVKLDEENAPILQGEGTEYEVVLNAPEGGFVSYDGTTVRKLYYIPVLPIGDFYGMEITFTDYDGNTFTKSNDSPGSFKRNKYSFMGHVPNPYDELPDEIVLSLDFTSDTNPLGTFNKIADQSADGDTYQYSYGYKYNGENRTELFDFTITRGSTRPGGTGYYQHIKPTETPAQGIETKVLFLVCNSGDTKIKLPAIRGRYLKSISFSVLNTDNRRFRIQNQAMNRYVSSPWAKAANTTEKATAIVEFPNAAERFPTTTMEVGYIMQFTVERNYYITDIKAVYTKTAPVAPADSESE